MKKKKLTPSRAKNNTEELSVVESLNIIYNEAKDGQLSNKIYNDHSKELDIVSEYLKCSKDEAFFFSVITTLNLYGEQVDFTTLCRFFDVSPFDLMARSKHITSLVEKKILQRRYRNHFGVNSMKMYNYSISSDVVDALMNGTEFPDNTTKEMNDTIEVLESIFLVADQCLENELAPREMLSEVKHIIELNSHFNFIKMLKSSDLSDVDKVILVYSTWKTLAGSAQIDIDEPIEKFHPTASQRIRYVQSLLNSENKLIKNGFIEIRPSRFFNDLEIELTNKVIEMLEEDGIKGMKPKKKGNQIEPGQIVLKNLFYNEQENEQINMIRNLLNDHEYNKLVDRLETKGLPLSMNILLFGAPGTGKTETVLQLAKNSGREILKVDISQTKSMWYGESEKLIKKIFLNYEELRLSSKLTPILLFNEADAILGKRKNNHNSTISQTENAIQNILLEELENFKGIFMATTNLEDNLDNAFDRRFLFKVRFSKPSIQAKFEIWKEKLPFLSENELYKLSEDFDLTGGQIENIVRKCEINFILKDESPDYSQIRDYCREESVLKKDLGKKIGFNQ